MFLHPKCPCSQAGLSELSAILAHSAGRLRVDALEQNSYDVIFMDCQMPEMGGHQVARRIRERESTRNGTERPRSIS